MVLRLRAGRGHAYLGTHQGALQSLFWASSSWHPTVWASPIALCVYGPGLLRSLQCGIVSSPQSVRPTEGALCGRLTEAHQGRRRVAGATGPSDDHVPGSGVWVSCCGYLAGPCPANHFASSAPTIGTTCTGCTGACSWPSRNHTSTACPAAGSGAGTVSPPDAGQDAWARR